MREKKFSKGWAIAGGLVLLVCIVALVFVGKSRKIVFYIDDIPIYKEEFLLQANQETTAVRHSLQADYAPEIFSWEQTFDEKTGTEWLVEKTITALVEKKMIQQTAYRQGLLESPKYPDIVNMIRTDNQQRQIRKQKGQVVFGLSQMSVREGMDYLNNNLTLQLPKVLWEEGEIHFTQQEVEAYYTQNKSYFLNQPLNEVENHVRQALLEEKTKEYFALTAEEAQVSNINTHRLVRLLTKEIAY